MVSPGGLWEENKRGMALVNVGIFVFVFVFVFVFSSVFAFSFVFVFVVFLGLITVMPRAPPVVCERKTK